MVDKDSPTREYVWFRWSMPIRLLENTVDITLTIDLSKKSVEVNRWCGFIPKKKSVDINCQCTLIPKKIGQRSISTVEVDMDSKKLWALPYPPILHNKRFIWWTRTLTSVHPDPFQALLTKQHTTKKPTHTDKMYDGHRVAHRPGLLGATAHLRFLVWRFKCLVFGPGRIFPRSQNHWPMVPYGPISDEKWSRTPIYKKIMVP